MHKIFSYLLLCVGLLLILFALKGMYGVFVTHQLAPAVVQFADLQLQTQYGPVTFPMVHVSTIANMCLFTLFMAFVAGVGAKIAGLGCQLLKNERIHDALLQLKQADLSRPESFKQL